MEYLLALSLVSTEGQKKRFIAFTKSTLDLVELATPSRARRQGSLIEYSKSGVGKQAYHRQVANWDVGFA